MSWWRTGRIEFWELKIQLRKLTQGQVCTALEAGMWSVGGDEAKIYRDEFATNSLIEGAQKDQEKVEWDHFVLGRIACSWQTLGPNTDDNQSLANTVGRKRHETGNDIWSEPVEIKEQNSSRQWWWGLEDGDPQNANDYQHVIWGLSTWYPTWAHLVFSEW